MVSYVCYCVVNSNPYQVLILVVVEDGLVLMKMVTPSSTKVLILVVVEDGLVQASDGVSYHTRLKS